MMSQSTGQAPRPEVIEPNRAVDTAVNPARAQAFTIESNISRTRYLKALIYSEWGAGKTRLAGTSVAVPSMRDVLLISAEGGELTLFDPENVNNIPFHLIDIVRVNDYKTMAQVYDFLKLHTANREAAKTDKDLQGRMLRLQTQLMPSIPDPTRLRLYRTCVIDTLTEIENYCMQQLLGISTDTTGLDEEDQKPEWAQYSSQRTMIHRLIRNFRNLPMHVIFACQRQYKENDQKRRIYAPAMTGKLSGEVQGFVDVVGHLVVGDASEETPIPERRMYVQPHRTFAAKSRFSRFKRHYFNHEELYEGMPAILREVGLPLDEL